MTLLSADAYFNRKVKIRNNVCGSHFYRCYWSGGWVLTPETLSKAFDNINRDHIRWHPRY